MKNLLKQSFMLGGWYLLMLPSQSAQAAVDQLLHPADSSCSLFVSDTSGLSSLQSDFSQLQHERRVYKTRKVFAWTTLGVGSAAVYCSVIFRALEKFDEQESGYKSHVSSIVLLCSGAALMGVSIPLFWLFP